MLRITPQTELRLHEPEAFVAERGFALVAGNALEQGKLAGEVTLGLQHPQLPPQTIERARIGLRVDLGLLQSFVVDPGCVAGLAEQPRDELAALVVVRSIRRHFANMPRDFVAKGVGQFDGAHLLDAVLVVVHGRAGLARRRRVPAEAHDDGAEVRHLLGVVQIDPHHFVDDAVVRRRETFEEQLVVGLRQLLALRAYPAGAASASGSAAAAATSVEDFTTTSATIDPSSRSNSACA